MYENKNKNISTGIGSNLFIKFSLKVNVVSL